MRLRSIIGKRWQLAALLAALTLALAAILWPRSPAQAGKRADAAAESMNAAYDFDLIFRPEESALAVTMTLRYTNATGETLNDLTLRTWAGAYAAPETSPAAIDELYEACYPNGFSPGGITLEGVWWNGTMAEAAFADAAQTVLQVAIPPLANGESGTLLLRCRLTAPECAHRFGHSAGVWQFGSALPILAVYRDGAWRQEPYAPIGDPFFSECANYTVTLTAPAGYACAATGRQTAETQGDGTIRWRMEAKAAREFAFALSDAWQSADTQADGVRITAYAPDRDGAKRAAKNAADALKIYGRLYGAYPWDTLTLCAVDFPFGGMEYPGLIFLSQKSFPADWADTLELTVAHETAHQWFYALVGSDPFYEPWQDEALCEYAMLRYVLEKYGRSAYENLRVTRIDAPMRERIPQRVTPATPIDGFGSLDAYTAVVYGRGAAFLTAAEEMTGKVDAFLKAYCDRFAFDIATRQDFIGLMNEVTGEDLTPLMTDYLDTLM